MRQRIGMGLFGVGVAVVWAPVLLALVGLVPESLQVAGVVPGTVLANVGLVLDHLGERARR